MDGIKEYVIYVRKSTEDNSWERQAQSIPDQIQKCIEFVDAHKETMKLKLKPEDFSDFETEEELRQEDNDKIEANRKIYKSTRKYYIIKERRSAHELWRPKWNKLLKKIKDGEIEGLLSYSPDRQARNLVDWGMLIEYVYQWLVDLKYTNFSFERTSTWIMMLWISFVFSRNYSDKLREDSGRWIEESIKKGIMMWDYKYWYIRNPETWYAEPHPKYFRLMKEAFRMKVVDNASDVVIAKWLNDNWFVRERKNWKEKKPINPTMLSEVRIDPFYSWIYVYWDNTVNLLETPWTNFQPMISKEWHDILLDRRLSKAKKPDIKAQTRKYEDIYSFPVWMIVTTKWHSIVPYIPKIWEKLKKLEILKKINPDATLSDVVNSKQVRYEVKSNSIKWDKTSKDTKNKTLAVNQNELETKMINSLNTIKISEKDYNKYLEFIKEELKNVTRKIETNRNILNMRLWKLRQERDAFVERFFWYEFKDEEEQKLYLKKKQEFDDKEDKINIELSWLTVSARNKEMEFSIFAKMLKNAGNYYKKASNVQKKKICKLLVSNIVVDSKKRLRVERNPSALSIFWKNSDNLRPIRNLPNNLAEMIINNEHFGFFKSIVQFYVTEMEPNFNIQKNFSNSQQILYGIAQTK